MSYQTRGTEHATGDYHMTTILTQFSDDLADVSAAVLQSLVQVRSGSRAGGRAPSGTPMV